MQLTSVGVFGLGLTNLGKHTGTGKNTLAAHPEFRIKGRTLLAEPFTSIMSQSASEAWHSGDRKDQVYANSVIEPTLRGFKRTDSESLKVNYETTLRGADLSKSNVVHCTYNQIMNITYDDLAEFDQIFIDECHVLSTDMSYRSDVITSLLNYLIEFVAKKQGAKTKILFMTGTPNVESIVIPQLMEEQGISHLYQRLIIKKTYQTKPLVHLTHLDTDVYDERQDAVIEKINDYLKQGRKVCHIFNNKSKMDQYIREIQSKLSPEIKVGLFYSGSTGECTNNILMGLFGKYDVLLTTNFFINGINIERDGLTEEEVLSGKKSKQKYGLILDLGQSHTKLNALDAIQALNRFRNRMVHTTVFLQKIFKPFEGKKFDIRHAAKVIRGINAHNYTMITGTQAEDQDEVELPTEAKEKYFLVGQVRRNPIFVSMSDVAKATKKEADREKVVDMMNKNLKVYDDWFYSLEGYYYLCKDAFLSPIIKHASKRLDLEAMEKEHEIIENGVVEAFLNNDEALEYLANQIDPEKRILVKSSDLIKDPESTVAENFRVHELINDRYVITGDFHPSHERALNYIIRCHLNFSHWYGSEQATELFRYLMDDAINITPGESSHYTTLMSRYYESCKISSPKKFSIAYGYLRSLDILAEKNIGIEKHVTPTSISYVMHDTKLVDALQDEYTNMLYDTTIWKIENSDSKEKEELKKYYSNKALMKEYDAKELKYALDALGIYNPYRVNEKGEITRPEQLHITRVLPSDKLMRPSEDFDTDSWLAPPPMNNTKYKEVLSRQEKERAKRIENQFRTVGNQMADTSPEYKKLGKLCSEFLDGKIITEKLESFASKYIPTDNKSKLKREFDELYSVIRDSREIFYTTFQHAEYANYYESKLHRRLPSMDKLFFTESDFTLSDLDEHPEPDEMIMLGVNWLVLEQIGDTEIPRYDPKYWVAFDSDGQPILARKTKGEFCRAICDWAYSDKGDDFLLHSGFPSKERDKGIYKYTTFARDYLKNTFQERVIRNYRFANMLIDIENLQHLKNNK